MSDPSASPGKLMTARDFMLKQQQQQQQGAPRKESVPKAQRNVANTVTVNAAGGSGQSATVEAPPPSSMVVPWGGSGGGSAAPPPPPPPRRNSIASGNTFNEFTGGIRAGWYLEFKSRKFRAAVLAELVGMILFVAYGSAIVTFSLFVPSVPGASDARSSALIANLLIALGFGLMITVLVFSIGDISGANLNPAVTIALALSRKMSVLRMLCYIAAQMIGACIGAGYVKSILPSAYTSHPAANGVNPGIEAAPDYSLWTPFGAELLGTYLLVFTVCCAADVGRDSHTKYVGALTPLTIGFAVFLAHLFLIPIDGCSINPARSFGSAAVSGIWTNHWVFWFGPITGSILACLSYEYIFKSPPITPQEARIAQALPFSGVGDFDPLAKQRTSDMLEGIERTNSASDLSSAPEQQAPVVSTTSALAQAEAARMARMRAPPASSGSTVGVEMSPTLSAASSPALLPPSFNIAAASGAGAQGGR